jgi:hypothetical protein
VGGGGNHDPVARGDTYATPAGKTLTVAASRVSGVLYNDFDEDGDSLIITGNTNPTDGTLTFNAADGSFTYVPDVNGGVPVLGDNENDSFTYTIEDGNGGSATATVNINILPDQPDFKIMMNYELGMHCTGFEFAYCCVLPPYNSILAQVVKPQATANPNDGSDFPRLLEGSHEVGLDPLNRPTVVQAGELNGNNFQTYMLEYFHDAQPRLEGQGKLQTAGPVPAGYEGHEATLISAVEGNSLFYTSTIYDSAAPDPITNELVYGTDDTGTISGVVQGSGTIGDVSTDNYANGWLNHFYIYVDPANPTPAGPNLEGHGATGQEIDKIRLGVAGAKGVQYPADVGAALQPMGPTGSAAPFQNLLTFSGDTGTVVYTQMKVLEDLPVMLTSPDIWEALGLPLTPFEDSIAFFAPGGPGSIDEDSIRPYVAMKAKLFEANCDQDPQSGTYGECSKGNAVLGSNGLPVMGHGTAPIDIPNCERCHSVTDPAAVNSPSNIRDDFSFGYAGNGLDPNDPDPDVAKLAVNTGDSLASITDAEYEFWLAYYNIVPGAGDSDWYARLKGAAINMLALHDFDQGTSFTENWPADDDTTPVNDPPKQNTRLGKESVICQKCHADNVIAVVKSATKGGAAIKPISEAIHWRHREINEVDSDTGLPGTIDFADATGRSGGCQGCHPAHRSDGVMDGYPITLGGDNVQANSDNRLAAGGCFVGRDVHSNPMKDVDGVETPAHLNAVGQWLATNVFYGQDGDGNVQGHDTRGLWCTNCHTQLGQEMWKAEDCNDLIAGDCDVDVRGLGSLSAIATAIGSTPAEVESWLDPKSNLNGHTTPDGIDHTHRIWDSATVDANVATIEVTSGDGTCADITGIVSRGDDDLVTNVNVLTFCTTDSCVSDVNDGDGDWQYKANDFIDTNNIGCPVPFAAATDGRDHWLSAGEPHCADCHTAPFVEPSGHLNPYPPFNYPRKASLMRYSKGHQNITCQGCHESIHGLYPVTPTIDSTSYAQAAALNPDGSHGPLKCAACHEVDSKGIPSWMRGVDYNGNRIRTFDDAVAWAHTFTRHDSVLGDADGACTNCHAYPKGSAIITEDNGGFLAHSYLGRVGRKLQDQAEIEALGHVAGDPDFHAGATDAETAQNIAGAMCVHCHAERGGPSDPPAQLVNLISCDNPTWKSHVFDGRLSEKVWEFMTETETGSTCGW